MAGSGLGLAGTLGRQAGLAVIAWTPLNPRSKQHLGKQPCKTHTAKHTRHGPQSDRTQTDTDAQNTPHRTTNSARGCA